MGEYLIREWGRANRGGILLLRGGRGKGGRATQNTKKNSFRVKLKGERGCPFCKSAWGQKFATNWWESSAGGVARSGKGVLDRRKRKGKGKGSHLTGTGWEFDGVQ